MKQVLKIAAVVLAVVLYCGCRSVVFSPKVDSLLAEVRKARDPQGKLATVNSLVMKGEFRSDRKNKPVTMEFDFKKPDKLRVKAVIPGKEAFVKAYNGKTAWIFRTDKGIKELQGSQLDSIRFQAKLLNPAVKLGNIFESIKLAGESVEVGEKCYKFECTPKPEFHMNPITFFVSKKSKLIVKRIETQKTDDGQETELVTIFNDYQPADGIMVARNIVSCRQDTLMEFNVKSVEWNTDLNNTFFNPPKAVK